MNPYIRMVTARGGSTVGLSHNRMAGGRRGPRPTFGPPRPAARAATPAAWPCTGLHRSRAYYITCPEGRLKDKKVGKGWQLPFPERRGGPCGKAARTILFVPASRQPTGSLSMSVFGCDYHVKWPVLAAGWSRRVYPGENSSQTSLVIDAAGLQGVSGRHGSLPLHSDRFAHPGGHASGMALQRMGGGGVCRGRS